jgi:hypothetical protein
MTKKKMKISGKWYILKDGDWLEDKKRLDRIKERDKD